MLEYIHDPVNKKINAVQEEDDQVIDDGNIDDFNQITEVSEKCIIGHDHDQETDGKRALRPRVKSKAIHLCKDDHGAKAKSEHGPEPVTLQDRHDRSMNDDEHFQYERPPLVDMNAVEDQRALDEKHEHVQEANQVSPGALGGVIPEGVNCCPGEQIAMIFTSYLDEAVLELKLPAEDQSAAGRFEQDDDD